MYYKINRIKLLSLFNINYCLIIYVVLNYVCDTIGVKFNEMRKENPLTTITQV